jgi:hypothetical protein
LAFPIRNFDAIFMSGIRRGARDEACPTDIYYESFPVNSGTGVFCMAAVVRRLCFYA